MRDATLDRPLRRVNRLGAGGKRKLFIWVFLAPTLIYFAVFQVLPILVGVYMSFYQGAPLLGRAQFMGLRNFVKIFTNDRLFWHSLRVTAVYVIGSVIATNAIGLFLALLMNRPIRGRGVIRSALYFPQMITGVVIALIFSAMMDPHTGVLNVLLDKVGLGPVRWLQSGRTALMSMVIVTAWHGLGYRMVIYLAGLQGIPEEYYDAARVDGATGLAEVWYITLPMLRDTILFNTVTATIGGFQSFALPFIMTGGGPANATLLYAYNIYQMAFDKLNFGYAAALSMVLFVIILLLSLLQLRIGRQRMEYY
jgi:multiple sugar transport system permease protein